MLIIDAIKTFFSPIQNAKAICTIILPEKDPDHLTRKQFQALVKSDKPPLISLIVEGTNSFQVICPTCPYGEGWMGSPIAVPECWEFGLSTCKVCGTRFAGIVGPGVTPYYGGEKT